jgi:hypothetical protein
VYDGFGIRIIMLFLYDRRPFAWSIFFDDCRVVPITVTIAMVGAHRHTGAHWTDANSDSRIIG